MNLDVRVFGGLEKLLSGVRFGESIPVDVAAGATVRELLSVLGIPPEKVFNVLVNGRHAEMHTVLHERDRISLFPPVGGG